MMAIEVTRESDELIEEMGAIGRLIERCEVCRKPTRWWAKDGDYPLCPPCAETHTDTRG